MYITINDIKGEKKIDLSYPIKNFDFAEIAVVSLFIKYKNFVQSWIQTVES